jgi:hypothetical protein
MSFRRLTADASPTILILLRPCKAGPCRLIGFLIRRLFADSAQLSVRRKRPRPQDGGRDRPYPASALAHSPLYESSRENYRRFATAAEAIRYAVEELRTPKAIGVWLQVGDERFNSSEIQRLYEASEYRLRKPE